METELAYRLIVTFVGCFTGTIMGTFLWKYITRHRKCE